MYTAGIVFAAFISDMALGVSLVRLRGVADFPLFGWLVLSAAFVTLSAYRYLTTKPDDPAMRGHVAMMFLAMGWLSITLLRVVHFVRVVR